MTAVGCIISDSLMNNLHSQRSCRILGYNISILEIYTVSLFIDPWEQGVAHTTNMHIIALLAVIAVKVLSGAFSLRMMPGQSSLVYRGYWVIVMCPCISSYLPC